MHENVDLLECINMLQTDLKCLQRDIKIADHKAAEKEKQGKVLMETKNRNKLTARLRNNQRIIKDLD